MIGYHLQSSVPVPNPDMPLVSMICPTFGRAAKQPELLNEALYWMVNQDYPNVEVLILNDAPGQTLVCNHPRVRVVNWPERLPNLGEKMNLGVMLAAGSICMPAEDDDISLLWRVSQSVSSLMELSGYDYWSPERWWFCQRGLEPQFDGNGYGFFCSAFRREALLGRFNSIILGHDRDAAIYASQHLRCNPKVIHDPFKVSFLYRWNVSEMHLSGQPDPESAWKHYFPGKDGIYKIEPSIGLVDWTDVTRKAANAMTGNPQ